MKPGDPAPELRLVGRPGQPVTLSSLTGQATIVNFWGAWCPPCRAEIPALIKLQNKYRNAGLTIIGVDIGDTRQQLEAFLKANPLNYEVWLENEARDSTRVKPLLRDWQNLGNGGYGVPFSFAVSRDGKIAYTLLGGDPSGAELEKLARAALK